MSHLLTVCWWLLVAHAFTDYVFQSEFMANAKQPESTYRRDKYGPWWWWMAAHGLINGAGVVFATGYVWLGIVESVVHSVTDYAKCQGHINTKQDQMIHVGSKGIYALIAAWRWW